MQNKPQVKAGGYLRCLDTTDPQKNVI